MAPPTPKGKRGRPWRYGHALYLALLLYRAFFRLTYRKTEASLQDLMEGPFPSHQSLARYAVRHLDKLLDSLGGAGLGEEVGAEVGGRGERPALLFHEEGLHVGLPGEEVLD